jgi:hypothetical protein
MTIARRIATLGQRYLKHPTPEALKRLADLVG